MNNIFTVEKYFFKNKIISVNPQNIFFDKKYKFKDGKNFFIHINVQNFSK